MTEFLVGHPPTYEPEREYIYDVMLRDFLGLEYEAKVGDRPHATEISLLGDSSGKRLIVHETLFSTAPGKWLTEDSLPRQPLDKWMMPDAICDTLGVSSETPVIYGQRISEDSYYVARDGDIQLGVDIFGSAFFMLTRYEEAVKSDRDEHDRFPAVASLACQEGFLERPIVNEYLEILWACMKRLWPGLKRKRRKYEVYLSHDVDRPLAVAGKPWPLVLRSCAADVLIRKDMDLVTRRINACWYARRGDFSNDPFNTFEFIMDVSEQYALQSSFYFMSVATPSQYDDRYHIGDPWIRKLIRLVSERGHEIGLHGSYRSLAEPAQTELELKRLLGVLHEEGAESSFGGGGRQHFLRWKAHNTWEVWNDAGLTYDSSLTYADCAGFRCGICYEYPTYSLRTRRRLGLRERPLVVMEGAILSSQYMGVSFEETYEHVCRLSAECRRFDGQFTLLWHNSSLSSRHEKKLYERVISMLGSQCK